MIRQRINRRSFLGQAAGFTGAGTVVLIAHSEAAGTVPATKLSRSHVAAVNRKRRVVINYDTLFGSPEEAERVAGADIDRVIKLYFSMIDEPSVQINSVWSCWLGGNYANYPSKILPVWEQAGFKKWWAAGIDPVRIFVDESRKRGIEDGLGLRRG